MRISPRVAVWALFAWSCAPLTAAAFDSSDYRTATYGAPTHYCDLTLSIASPSGAGTLGDPWNATRCMTQPVAGNVVGILPVGAGTPVSIPTTNNDNVPAWNPTNSGTSGNPIVYVTKYAAVSLDRSTIASNQNRSEFRHNGSAPSISGGVGAGTGCPMLGGFERDYITYDGFFIDMAQAYMKEDSGVIRPDNATGIVFKNFVIKGATLTVASNAVIYRPQDATDTILSNFRAYDFSNDPTGSATPQAALFSDQYGDQNFLIEHFDIDNIDMGIFLKGSGGTGALNYGTVQYGIIRNSASFLRFNALHASETTTVRNVLAYNSIGARPNAISPDGIVFDVISAGQLRNLTLDHITVAKLDAADGNLNGGINTEDNTISGNVVITNNVFDIDSGTFGNQVSFLTTLPATLNYNCYTKNGSTETYVYNGSSYNTFESWKAAISGRDANSVEVASVGFTDRANDDYHITSGSCATGSSTGGEMGAYGGTSQTIGVDLEGADVTPPSAPTGFRIVP